MARQIRIVLERDGSAEYVDENGHKMLPGQAMLMMERGTPHVVTFRDVIDAHKVYESFQGAVVGVLA